MTQRSFYGNTITYVLPQEDFDVTAFTLLQKESKQHGIVEWNLQQPSLTDVFINICGK